MVDHLVLEDAECHDNNRVQSKVGDDESLGHISVPTILILNVIINLVVNFQKLLD